MLTGWERPSHWLVLAVVVVVLFGYKKLPDASRAVGRSLRIFKTEMKGLNDDEANPAAEVAVQPVAVPPVAVPPVAVPPVAVVPVVAPPVAVPPVAHTASVMPPPAVPAAVSPLPVASPITQPVVMQQPAQLVENPAPARPANS